MLPHLLVAQTVQKYSRTHLAYQLRPSMVPFDSLDEIAQHCAVTRQALSEALLQLRDVSGCRTLRHGKRESARDSYKVSAREGWKKRIARLQAQGAAN